MLNKPYTLGLAGDSAPSINDCTTSGQMLIVGLHDEFKKLEHVNVSKIDIEKPRHELDFDSFLKELPFLDFLLVRRYTSSTIIKNISVVKKKIRYRTCSFIEHSQPNFDYCFSFLNAKGTDFHIILPYIKKFMVNVVKTPKTILIDENFKHVTDISIKIMEWLSPLIAEGYKIYHLCDDKAKLPDGIIPLRKSNYEQYMNATSKIETFIQTHSGSYEHSVIDMAGRGIRVFVPNIKKKCNRGFYIPEETVKTLQLPTFTNKDSLISLIKKPVDSVFWNSRIHEMTEMKQIVNTIDNYFQTVIGNS